MSNTSLSPNDRQHIHSDLEILRLMLNLIDALCYEDKKLALSYMLDDVKAEIQHVVYIKEEKLKLDKKNSK